MTMTTIGVSRVGERVRATQRTRTRDDDLRDLRSLVTLRAERDALRRESDAVMPVLFAALDLAGYPVRPLGTPATGEIELVDAGLMEALRAAVRAVACWVAEQPIASIALAEVEEEINRP